MPSGWQSQPCSTVARTLDFLALALAVRFDIGLPTVFRRWIWLVLPRSARKFSLAFERQAVSAQTSEAVFVGSINPSRNRAPSWAADKAVPSVDPDVGFVAEGRNGEVALDAAIRLASTTCPDIGR